MIVLDSNIFFSALLSKNSRFVEILQNDDLQFTAPNFVFTEIFKYKEKIVKYSKLNEAELLELLNNILAKVQFIPIDFISSINLKRALEICVDIDPKDSIFVALSLELNALLWTGDKALKDGLSAKGFNKFFTP